MCKVSVIIPVYNGETYLAQCLDSIIGQTLKEIEIKTGHSRFLKNMRKKTAVSK